MSFKTFTKSIGGFLYKNSPQLLSGLACAGVISTAVLTANARLKTQHIKIEEFKKSSKEEKKKFGIELAKNYAPAVISGVATITCIVTSQRINSKRMAVVAGLYSMSKEALATYQAKVIETVGEKAEKKIRTSIDEDKLKNNPVNEKSNIFIGKGDVLCYDSQSGRYFYTEYETIRSVVNDLNKRLLSEHFVSLNEFYDELGIANIKQGDEMGWGIDHDDSNGGLISVDFDTMLTDDHRPCIVLNYDVVPKAVYY